MNKFAMKYFVRIGSKDLWREITKGLARAYLREYNWEFAESELRKGKVLEGLGLTIAFLVDIKGVLHENSYKQ